MVEERISAKANRDGGLQSLEVNGTMLLKVNDGSKAKLRLQLEYSPDENLQFKTHPNVDKGAWSSSSLITLKDPSRPFPVSQPLGILKWRYSSRDESKIPLLVNCWPSPTGKGTCDVTIEYELQSARLELHNVCIIIPYSGQVTQPGTAGTGTCVVDRQSNTIKWTIDKIEHALNAEGLLEFSIDSEDVSILYPIQVHFTSTSGFVDLKVLSK